MHPFHLLNKLQIKPIADINHYRGNWREDAEGMRHPKIIKYKHIKMARFYFVILGLIPVEQYIPWPLLCPRG